MPFLIAGRLEAGWMFIDEYFIKPAFAFLSATSADTSVLWYFSGYAFTFATSLFCQHVCSKKGALREFLSAPIVKRLDLFKLQSTDGIFIILQGQRIDKHRTLENGFSSEVFRHFVIGFPPKWEECAKKHMIPEAVSKARSDDSYSDADDISLLIEIENDASDHGGTTTTSRLNVPSLSVAEPDNIIGSLDQGDANLVFDVPGTSDCQAPQTSENQKFKTVEGTTSKEVNFTSVRESEPLKGSTFKDGNGESSCGPRSTKQNLRATLAKVDTKCVSPDNLVGSRAGPGISDIEKGARTTATEIACSANESCKKIYKRSIVTRSQAKKIIRDTSLQATSKPSSSRINDESRVSAAKRRKGSSRCQKKTKRKLDYDEQRTPKTIRNIKKKIPTSSASSTFKTSRSGRILLPTMEFWRNQIPIYDMGGELSGIKEGSSLLKIERGRRTRS